jgi:hypothetical protein
MIEFVAILRRRKRNAIAELFPIVPVLAGKADQ